jgi:hypothetical protein
MAIDSWESDEDIWPLVCLVGGYEVGPINLRVPSGLFGSYPHYYADIANVFARILSVPQPSFPPSEYLRPTIRYRWDDREWLRMFETYFPGNILSGFVRSNQCDIAKTFSWYTVVAVYLL